MIISASRRTDIPAFYHEWLINRLKAQSVQVRNPFNARQIRRVSLAPQDVDAIVFWTRNAAPLLPHLSELQSYCYYFHYTITGYPSVLEPHCPPVNEAVKTFCQLSDAIGAERMIWRYDPILLSNVSTLPQHRLRFQWIAEHLAGKTHQVMISFADFYRKTTRNLDRIPNLDYQDLRQFPDQLRSLCAELAEIGQQYQLTLTTCAEALDLSSLGIEHGQCINNTLIHRLSNTNVAANKDRCQRAHCRCVKSIDIGRYNTCLHGCAYCYATFSSSVVNRNYQHHDKQSSFLI